MASRAQRGQAAVEAVLVAPLMVGFCLCVLQLSLLEQGRLFTRAAAYSAVRAGVVWNGNNERMRDAALFALLPAFGKTEAWPSVVGTYGAVRALDRSLAELGVGEVTGDLPEAFRRENLRGLLRVDTLCPAAFSGLSSVWNLRGSAQWEELDADLAGTFPAGPSSEAHFVDSVERGREDGGQQLLRRATVLSIRLRTFYELKVPFADWLIFAAFFAAHGARGIDPLDGFASVTAAEMRTLWKLATVGVNGRRHVLIPLVATARMRMQSAFFRKWLMHASPTWEP